MKTNVIFKSAMLFAMMSMSTMMMAQTQVQVHEKVKRQPVEVQLNNKTMLKERQVKTLEAQPQVREIKNAEVSKKSDTKAVRPTTIRRHAELRRTRIVADTALSRKTIPAMKMKEAPLRQ